MLENRCMKVHLYPLDFAALVLALSVAGGSAALVYGPGGEDGQFLIRGDGKVWVYPAETEGVFAVPGPLGDTVIELKGGRARVLSSPCENQTCVTAGAVHARGEWAACLPNRVMVSVEPVGDGGDGPGAQDVFVDAVSY